MLGLSVVAVALTAPACAGESSQRYERGPARAPAAGGYFRLAAVGASFPTERECARRVRRSSWEPRPGNYRANHLTPRRLRLRSVTDYDTRWNERYRARITGAFVGTTDEIIQWSACKWGLSDEIMRAQALVESRWHQAARGDPEPRSEGNCTVQDRSDPCPTSFGLLQNKWYFNRAGYPMLRTMTSFHLDWSAAQLRGCYDGRKGFPAGHIWACLGNWFPGRWNDPQALDYIARVRAELAAKPWREWDDRGGTVPYRIRLRPVARALTHTGRSVGAARRAVL